MYSPMLKVKKYDSVKSHLMDKSLADEINP